MASLNWYGRLVTEALRITVSLTKRNDNPQKTHIENKKATEKWLNRG